VVALLVLTAMSATTWVVLAGARGGFWRLQPRLRACPPPQRWPSVVVVVPARDEADLLPLTLPSLLAQEYPGAARVVLVDDQSTDGTAEVARALARCAVGDEPCSGATPGIGEEPHPGATSSPGDATTPTPVRRLLPLAVVGTGSTPAGWTGKLWALHEGVAQASDAEMVLLTDADIAHPPGSLARLVAAAEIGRYDQVSLMARLAVVGAWERLLVPAFIYFFAMLYPFRWVARRPLRHSPPPPRRAAAAGGCLLVRSDALQAAGGVDAVRGAVIDDVSLARALARSGARLWLGFADDVHSVRPYEGLGALWAMVTRSAFAQLRYSMAALAGTVAGLLLVFVVPPVGGAVALACGWPVPGVLGIGAWVLMTVTYLPMQRYHGLRRWRAGTLPLAAVIYLAMTVDSARRHHRGAGATWKGRTYGTGHTSGPDHTPRSGRRFRPTHPTSSTIPAAGRPNTGAPGSTGTPPEPTRR
jgi:hopene-associated glycosyltransferase HpnB